MLAIDLFVVQPASATKHARPTTLRPSDRIAFDSFLMACIMVPHQPGGERRPASNGAPSELRVHEEGPRARSPGRLVLERQRTAWELVGLELRQHDVRSRRRAETAEAV